MSKEDERNPKLEGKVIVDIATGMFKCQFRLKNLPAISEYRILLHKGMNIKYFKDAEGALVNYKGYYSGSMHHVGLEYQLINKDKDKMDVLPSFLFIEYVGAFPVYDKDYNAFDFKGYIANNGQTVRATEQSKWYPVIYDSINDRYFDQYCYELEIEGGEHCKSIFINGSAPQKGGTNSFSSNKAVPLFLFIGNYDFTAVKGNYIINADLTNEKAGILLEEIETIKSMYLENIGIECEDSIYLIKHVPVDKMEKDRYWGFNIYPAFAFAGINFNDLLTKEGRLKDKYVELFSHELAHNYFSTNVMSGKLFWFWLESCTDYISFAVVEQKCGRSFLLNKLKDYMRKVEHEDFIPLGKIKHAKDIDTNYRYYLGPLIMKCFEIQFGVERTYGVLKALLAASAKKTLTITEWKSAALQAKISEDQFETFRVDYLLNEQFKDKVIDQIKKYCE